MTNQVSNWYICCTTCTLLCGQGGCKIVFRSQIVGGFGKIVQPATLVGTTDDGNMYWIRSSCWCRAWDNKRHHAKCKQREECRCNHGGKTQTRTLASSANSEPMCVLLHVKWQQKSIRNFERIRYHEPIQCESSADAHAVTSCQHWQLLVATWHHSMIHNDQNGNSSQIHRVAVTHCHLAFRLQVLALTQITLHGCVLWLLKSTGSSVCKLFNL